MMFKYRNGGNGGFPGRNLERSKGGARVGPKERKAATAKPMEVNGPKFKQARINKPMRGLVFGPAKGEALFSSSGKRLRVEGDSLGLTGGALGLNGGESVEGGAHRRTDSGESGDSQNALAIVPTYLMMNCILWNCRGANKSNFRRSIRYLLKKYETDVLAIFETHAGGNRAAQICHGIGFENSYRVDAVGQSGGLWLLCRSDAGTVEIVEAMDQFIHAKVVNGLDILHLIVVYAAPTASRRSGLWNQLREVIQGVAEPVLIGGDFNTIVRLDERTGGNGRLSADSLSFGDWINDLSLIDMGFCGNKFTWRRGCIKDNFVAKRLDRVLCCAHTRLQWQEAVVTHLPFLASDHAPLYVHLSPEADGNPGSRPFRFEAAWLKHEGFKELLLTSWNGNINTPESLNGLRKTLSKWNKEVFGDVQKRKEKLMREIKEVQDMLDHNQSDALLKREEDLTREFDVVLEHEEMIWYHKSREKWIVLGERNTKFFHTSTIIRRRRNRIEMLRDDDGRWISSSQDLEKLATDYYRKLYSMEDVDSAAIKLPSDGFVRLTDQELTALNKNFLPGEVEKAIKSMGKYKALGPDGFQPIFYHHCWEVLGSSVVRFVLDFFETGELPKDTNDALVVLIAKVVKPEKITQFRPIRRLSTDNIVVVQEAVHSMRRKKGRKGWMLLKLDLEKAYDRVRWDFLEDTIRASGLSDRWVRWIMQCVSYPSMSVLWNGEKTNSFKPLRGLRQGDPLSPYLFVLCLERLCHLIDRSIANKDWKPISISRGGPKLSHICFADDLILFAEASITQIRVIRGVLEEFCKASGQKVSLEKSKKFFSENVSRDLEKMISDESGIKATRDLGKYLGMPVLQKRINKETFRYVLERASTRLAGWKSRVLSMAGRLTLTKVVLSSLPVHTMSTIVLPKSILTGLDKISRGFLWGSTLEKRKQHLVAWKRVCLPKDEGGLGIRGSEATNMALIAKLGWRLLHDCSSLWARVLRSKYKVGDVHDGSWLVVKGTWSSTWRSVAVGLREVVLQGLSWVIGDGRRVKFWSDKWLSSRSLMEEAVMDLPSEYKELTVRDFWQEGRGWMMERISPFVSVNTRLELGAVVLDNVTGARDRISWSENVGDTSWSTLFAMAVWWGWNWRCGNVFGENRKCRDRVRFVKELAAEVTKANLLSTEQAYKPARVERMIGWVATTAGWVKLNTDGASRGNPGPATAGGVLRDGDGAWCGGFALNIGRCSAPLAELWGVYYGLYLTWDRKVSRLVVEVDSEMVVGFLKTGINDTHPLSFLVRLCHDFISRDWIVRIDHVYREANFLADGLAEFAFSLPLGFHLLNSVPEAVASVMSADTLGTFCPRRVCM
ncbi:Ribonuclease H domain [Arabidopsis thaliana x Arabidopsis arenosa]|uniref:Ribonuclease H domain n=1 Tax=Arabidopsis thaliana x Arabidopsis arenosa TaxID=1240361 RepID=A0A8T2B057_9BRAS|nr:Ribonuclease H domain [Arabidopsis thaliana x Arabidopsis arenosa]